MSFGEERISIGTYRARGLSATLGETKTKRSPQVEVVCELQLGNDTQGSPVTRCMGWYGSLVGGAVPITMEALRTFGWSNDDLSAIEGIDGTTEVEVVVKEEVFEGETRVKIAYVNKPGGARIAALEPTAAKALAAQLKGYAVASRQKGAGARPAAKPAAAPGGAPRPAPQLPVGVDEGDVPF